MKYIIFLACSLLFISARGISQSKEYHYYFDESLKITEKPKSVFNGTGIINDGVLEFKMYDNTGRLLLKAHYTDSSLLISHGLFQFYYDNGLLKKEENYVKGKEDGLFRAWDSLGRTTDSTLYGNGNKIMEANTRYYENGVLSSFSIDDIKNDRLSKTYYDDKGKLSSEVSFIGKEGIIKHYKGTMNGRIDTVFTRDEIEASFPGGERAWTQYVSSQIQRHYKELVKDGLSGVCRVKFTVGKEGKIINVEALTMQNTVLARVAVNAIKNGPKWSPASQYGKPVNAFREQPVTFRLTE